MRGDSSYARYKNVPHYEQQFPEVIYEWNQLNYVFPDDQALQAALNDQSFIPGSGIPVDVQPYHNEKGDVKVFVSTPRFGMGIPYTLSTIANNSSIEAYPSYEWHNRGEIADNWDCDKITSTFRTAITECEQLWVLDSGMAADEFKCPPQLLLFDLRNDQLVHRFRFNASHFTASASLFVTNVVQVNDPPPIGNCQNAMVYVADTDHHGLLVYDYAKNEAWRIENKFMYPDPDYGTHTLAGQSFTLMDGIIGLSFDDQYLYFHPMAGITEYAVPLDIINNSTLFAGNKEAAADEFKSIGKRSSPCVPSAIDSKGIWYCVTFNPIELIAWNIKKKDLQKLPIKREHLEFVGGLKVIKNKENKEELWMLSNRFQRLATGTVNGNEVNYRIVRRRLDR
uniref:Bee-milk protein n=1 Tax=Glossina brevipalpis TaxID=37001 RepID=A0A1A9WGF4_9MUSC